MPTLDEVARQVADGILQVIFKWGKLEKRITGNYAVSANYWEYETLSLKIVVKDGRSGKEVKTMTLSELDILNSYILKPTLLKVSECLNSIITHRVEVWEHENPIPSQSFLRSFFYGIPKSINQYEIERCSTYDEYSKETYDKFKKKLLEHLTIGEQNEKTDVCGWVSV